MTNSPNWIGINTQIGWPAPGYVWTDETGDITTNTIQHPPLGTVAQYYDNGTTQLCAGEFIWLLGVASTVAGDVVSYIGADGAGAKGVTTRWAGTGNTGGPLAVATAATVAAAQGWYQIGGAAIVNTSGTVVAGNPLYYAGTTALMGASASNGKQVMGAIAGSANGVPATNQTIVTLDRPTVQGQTS